MRDILFDEKIDREVGNPDATIHLGIDNGSQYVGLIQGYETKINLFSKQQWNIEKMFQK